ncbi:MAG TPA: hydrogenase formation protein HypD [Candidatus Omnitrophota bacterium]|nr:hydrogenase formation protein HypD [Candidatus Omnitrophota bacterium]
MRYVDEYRDVKKVKKLADLINSIATRRSYKIMEVCGTHTSSIQRFGIKSLLPANIELISGPGCPVCVTSEGYIKSAIELSKKDDVIIATYPDMIRVPSKAGSLEKARSEGSSIRQVNSAIEALKLAQKYPEKEIVFLAVGFETTSPGTAIALRAAKERKIRNFSVYCAHKTIPEALMYLAESGDVELDGFLLPGHVSVIIGMDGYKTAFNKMRLPSVISGFEPLDIMWAIYRIILSVNSHRPVLENAYKRIVRDSGNARAKAVLKKVFYKSDSFWRGLGVIKKSGLSLNPCFKEFDAIPKFSLKEKGTGSFSCKCASVLKGLINPAQCVHFCKTCSPESPKGPCMVSKEGTCRAYYENKINSGRQVSSRR